MDIDKILISNKVSFGKNGYKYLAGCKDNGDKLSNSVLCFKNWLETEKVLMKLDISIFRLQMCKF